MAILCQQTAKTTFTGARKWTDMLVTEKVQQNLPTRNVVLFTKGQCRHVHWCGASGDQVPDGDVLKYKIAVWRMAVIDAINIGTFKDCLGMN
jgi:hypothetical protein